MLEYGINNCLNAFFRPLHHHWCSKKHHQEQLFKFEFWVFLNIHYERKPIDVALLSVGSEVYHADITGMYHVGPCWSRSEKLPCRAVREKQSVPVRENV